MRFASLGSGSEGNALLVEDRDTRILIDCGFSLTETERRLARRGINPADLTAIVVTHEHSDHRGGVSALARRCRCPVYGSFGTLNGLEDELGGALCCVRDWEPFALGGFEILPYAVPHDAREPLQFVIGNGRFRLGILTDAGSVTPHIRAALTGCHALFLETNYDPELLANGPYPDALKARVSGPFGHLDNGTAAQLLDTIVHPGLHHVVAAHLSQKNNRIEWVRSALAPVLGCQEAAVLVADQREGTDWFYLD